MVQKITFLFVLGLFAISSMAGVVFTTTQKVSFQMCIRDRLIVDYAIYPSGEMRIEQKLQTTQGANVPNMLRFGMVMQLPYDMEQSEFFGRGPIENYADRKFSQRFGIYQQTADEQFYPYIRPQETGTKSDMRWWKQTNKRGMGLLVRSDKPFSASALHYTVEDLDDGVAKEQRHVQQVPKSLFTNLYINSEMAGVGGCLLYTSRCV